MKASRSTKDRLLLIDGDLVMYQILAATEQETEIEPDVWSITNDLYQFKDAFRRFLEEIENNLGGRIVVCLSDSANFRKTIYPEYKGNRKNVRKPVGFKAARTWIEKEFKAVVKKGLEADDVMGILATKPGNDHAVIVSMDKDMKSIPGKLFRYREGEKIVITKEQADRYHLVQTLTGDSTDNYPGCPGVGPKKAEDILNKPGDPWTNVQQAFIAAGLGADTALIQARLARILRWDDWDDKQQQPRLWTPASPPDRSVQPGPAVGEVDGGPLPQ